MLSIQSRDGKSTGMQESWEVPGTGLAVATSLPHSFLGQNSAHGHT